MTESQKMAKDIRRLTLYCIHSQGSGHVGGSLSIADVLAVLYTDFMRVDPKDPDAEGRDRLVLSKGHAGPALYATLSLKGFFDRSELLTLNKLHTKLPSHCNVDLTPGVDMTAGSLGQGLSCACGLALGGKMKGEDSVVYAICGDGELQEGQNWEALMFASAKKLNNLVVFVDNNKMQIDGMTQDVIAVENLEDKFAAFGFSVQRVDGHDHAAIAAAVKNRNPETPNCIILDTVKGKGVSFYENMGVGVHSTTVNDEQYAAALAELQ